MERQPNNYTDRQQCLCTHEASPCSNDTRPGMMLKACVPLGSGTCTGSLTFPPSQPATSAQCLPAAKDPRKYPTLLPKLPSPKIPKPQTKPYETQSLGHFAGLRQLPNRAGPDIHLVETPVAGDPRRSFNLTVRIYCTTLWSTLLFSSDSSLLYCTTLNHYIEQAFSKGVNKMQYTFQTFGFTYNGSGCEQK